ncbi:MAG: dephospho-CoA kinase [Clostridia bacterium]|nr:dephospho-CoA kinase [Clostridia bacterium]
MSFLICVTGKSGSGKSTFARYVAAIHDCTYIDVDEIGHDSLIQEDVIHGLCQNFGKEILGFDGKIDRKKLGKIVFNDKSKMEILNDLTWQYMERTIDSHIQRATKPVVIDWILLPKTKYWELCDIKVLVEADITKRKQVVVARDNISEEYFDSRDSASIDYSPYSFDYVFFNDYSSEALNKMLETFKLGGKNNAD